ncbi:nucleophile aminohydrolase [Chytridium lagenaria]|nr:nucleophile aminohydrolase [Chytridium lagenaria]
MEVLIGIVGKDFVLTAADTTSARSIVVQKQGEDKSRALNSHNLLLFSGKPGIRNVRLYTIRHGVELSTKAVASYTRRELAQSLRSRSPYSVNSLIAGSDASGTPELYWLDYLASSVKLDFAAHGHASYFVMSTMDRYWKEGLSVEEAVELLRKCLEELKVRYIVNMPNFMVKVVDKNGIREIPFKM